MQEGSFSFHYDSTVTDAADKSQFFFNRCVTTTMPKPLWVDWKGTSVQGWTTDENTIQTGIPWSTKDSEPRKTYLFYGTAAKKVETSFLAPKDAKVAFAGPRGTLKSFAKLGLAPPPGENGQPVERPVDVHFVFESSAITTSPELTLYTFSWRNDRHRAGVGSEIYVDFPGGEKSDRPFVMRALIQSGGTSKSHLKLTGDARGGSYTDKSTFDGVGRAIQEVRFLDERGVVLGSAPVTVLMPRYMVPRPE